MKCPKCGYLGFDSGERCRNCGYDFSLVSQPGKPPLRDAPLSRGSRSRHAARTPGADRSLSGDPQGTPIDLPLFGGDAPVLPPPRAPLAVRRSAPTPARVRSRAPVPRASAAPLLDSEPADVPTPPPAPTPRAAGGRLVQGEWASAPPGRRAAAAAIDVGLVALIDVVVLHFTLALCGLTFSDLRELPTLPMGAFLLMLNGGYLVFLTGTLGQTFGKMAAEIEVVSERRATMDLRRAALRGAALVVSLLPAGLGWLAGLVGDRRGLHDRLAGTRVVRVEGL